MKIFDIFAEPKNLNSHNLLLKNSTLVLKNSVDSFKEKRKVINQARKTFERDFAKGISVNYVTEDNSRDLLFRSVYLLPLFQQNDGRQCICLSTKDWSSVSAFFLSFVNNRFIGCSIYNDFLFLKFVDSDKKATVVNSIHYGHSVLNANMPNSFVGIKDNALFVARRSNYVN